MKKRSRTNVGRTNRAARKGAGTKRIVAKRRAKSSSEGKRLVPAAPPDVADFVEELLTSILQDLYGNPTVLDRVVASYERLDRKFPGHPRIQARLAHLRRRQESAARASSPESLPGGAEGLLAEFVSGLASVPSEEGHAHLEVLPPTRETSEQRYRRLKERLSTGRFEKPDEILAEVHRAVTSAVAPGDHEAAYNLGLAYRDMGALEGAVEWFRRAQLSPNRFLQATFLLATCQADLHRREEAVTELRRALDAVGSVATPGELIEIRYLLAELLRSLGRGEEASTLYREVQALQPGFREVESRLRDSA